MTVLIILLFISSLGLFIYSFFAKDYQAEIDEQVNSVRINLMREIIELKKQINSSHEGGENRG